MLAVLVGCGGGGNDGDEQVESTATSAATASVVDTTGPVDTAATTEPTEPATTAVATTSPPTTTVAEGLIPDTATIALLTHGAGLGARPLLRWEAADGAVSYVVSVNAPNGGPLWAWKGRSPRCRSVAARLTIPTRAVPNSSGPRPGSSSRSTPRAT